MKTLIQRARKCYQNTGSTLTTQAFLETEFPHLSEEQIDEVMQELYEEIEAKKEYKGEQQSDLERGN